MPDKARMCCVGWRKRKHAGEKPEEDEDRESDLYSEDGEYAGVRQQVDDDSAEMEDTMLALLDKRADLVGKRKQVFDGELVGNSRELIDPFAAKKGGTTNGPIKISLTLAMAAAALCAFGYAMFVAFDQTLHGSTTSTVTTGTTTITTSTSIASTTTVAIDPCHALAARPSDTCPGPIRVEGYGVVQAVKAGSNVPGFPTGPVTISDCSNVVPTITSRIYFGEECTPGLYSNFNYATMNLLGRTFSYTINLAGANCGCVAALYLVSMRQNSAPGNCGGDFYCDANNVCGVGCAEVDLMEANRFIWKTTLHAATDPAGHHSQLSSPSYGPGSGCINTDSAFQVRANVAERGGMIAVVLTQGACTVQVPPVTYPDLFGPLSAGMTPVVSYWYPVTGSSMTWFDGAICSQYNYKLCAPTVQLSNFAVSPPIK